MGTDAHGLLQRRLRGAEHWFTVAHDIQLDPNYLLFALLAKVRLHRFIDDSVQVIGQHCLDPKGLPEDWLKTLAEEPEEDDSCTAWVRRWLGNGTPEAQGIDGHTPTWLSYEELTHVGRVYFMSQALAEKPPTAFPCPPPPLISVDLEAILRYLGVYESRGDTTRLVVWFDS